MPEDAGLFQIGDIVEWCGVEGVVRLLDASPTYPLKVEFQDTHKISFTPDGRFFIWHIKPSLVLVSGKRKVKKIKKVWLNMNLNEEVFAYRSDDLAKAMGKQYSNVVIAYPVEIPYEVEGWVGTRHAGESKCG